MTNTASALRKTEIGSVRGWEPYHKERLIYFLASSQINTGFHFNSMHLRQLQLLFPLSSIKN